jgi:hypothetical protein
VLVTYTLISLRDAKMEALLEEEEIGNTAIKAKQDINTEKRRGKKAEAEATQAACCSKRRQPILPAILLPTCRLPQR